jgi:hypothetical protein
MFVLVVSDPLENYHQTIEYELENEEQELRTMFQLEAAEPLTHHRDVISPVLHNLYPGGFKVLGAIRGETEIELNRRIYN